MSLNTFLRCLISFCKCWSLEHTLKALGHGHDLIKAVRDFEQKTISAIKVVQLTKYRGVVGNNNLL